MKIALSFAKAQTFDFTSLRQGQFLANDGEKPKILKALSKDTQRVLFHYRSKFLLCALLGQSPNPKKAKAKAKAKMALASLVSSQKQKHTIVKIFMKSDAKSGFQRVESRTFIVSLVDTR